LEQGIKIIMAPGKGEIHEPAELAGRVVVPTAKGISHMLIVKQLVSSIDCEFLGRQPCGK
jgi:hypothetical protein